MPNTVGINCGGAVVVFDEAHFRKLISRDTGEEAAPDTSRPLQAEMGSERDSSAQTRIRRTVVEVSHFGRDTESASSHLAKEDIYAQKYPLHHAAKYAPHLLSELVGKGYSPNIADSSGETPLCLLANHHPMMLDALLDAGARIDSKVLENIAYKPAKYAQVLINAGAKVFKVNIKANEYTSSSGCPLMAFPSP